MGYGILCEYGQIIGVDQLRDTVIDLGVDMVRSAGQHNTAFVVCFHKPKDFFSLIPHVLSGMFQLCPGVLCCVDHRGDGQLGKLSGESGGDRLQVAEGQEGVAEQDFSAADLLHVVLDIFRVGCDDGAVIVVVGLMEFVTFVEKRRIEDKIHSQDTCPCASFAG